MPSEEGSPRPARHPAALGALVAVACVILVAGAVAFRTPHLLATVLGPPPLPAVLAGVSVLTGALAGALAGRRASRTPGAARERIARVAVSVGIAYLGAVTAAVVAVSLAEQGPIGLAFPFELVARGISVALVLAPWAALPLLGAAVAVERLTRPTAPRPPRVRVIPPRV